jgi:hypothetical protein
MVEFWIALSNAIKSSSYKVTVLIKKITPDFLVRAGGPKVK